MSGSRILVATDAVGGVWTYSVDLARSLREHGVSPIIATLGPAPSDAQLAAVGTIPLIMTDLTLDWMAESPSDVRRSGSALAQLAEDAGADIVQLPSAALASGVRFAQPVVAVQHSCVATWWEAVRETPLPHDFAWRRELIERGLNAVDAVVAPTAAFAAQLSRQYDPAGPIFVVHNGRSPIDFNEAPFENSVLTVGRLWDEGKGLATLDEAAARLDAPVDAIGSLAGPNGTSVQARHVRALGALDEKKVTERLASRPVFASSAIYEPFGLSVLEAAQAGCPLILSDIPTFQELWSESALFVPVRDADAFANSIRKLLRNPDLRAAYGRAAQIRSRRFTPESMAAGMMAIYDQIACAPADGKVASTA